MLKAARSESPVAGHLGVCVQVLTLWRLRGVAAEQASAAGRLLGLDSEVDARRPWLTWRHALLLVVAVGEGGGFSSICRLRGAGLPGA